MRAESKADHCIILLDFSNNFHGANDTVWTFESKGYDVNYEHLSAPWLRGAGPCLVLYCSSVCLEVTLKHVHWKWDTCTWFKYPKDCQGSKQTLSSSSSCSEAAIVQHFLAQRCHVGYDIFTLFMMNSWDRCGHAQGLCTSWCCCYDCLGFIDLDNWRTSLAH